MRVVVGGVSAEQMLRSHGLRVTRPRLAVLALGVATLLMMIVVRSATLPQWSQIAASAVVVALALVAGYYIVRTGDSGAHVVWSGF